MDEATTEVFTLIQEYENVHPGIVEAMDLLGLSMEQYQASLSALYNPRIVTSSCTEDLSARVE